MSLELKVTVQKGVAKTQSQQEKINDLILQIEQQKQKLAQFQQAKEQLQQHAREKLLPLYTQLYACLLYTSPSPRDRTRSRMPSSA